MMFSIGLYELIILLGMAFIFLVLPVIAIVVFLNKSKRP